MHGRSTDHVSAPTLREVIVCVDVDYRSSGGNELAVAAAVAIARWEDAVPTLERVVRIERVEPYEAGAFYRRELPCLLSVLAAISMTLTAVVIDGYVWLAQGRAGLGARLFDALGTTVPVIGVAKTAFRDNDAARVDRLARSS